jgi:signal transduction histidine kinase
MIEPIDPPKEGREIFRPYARLVSILGDQLISSKWVGVIELVKNSYDADAEKVSVRFVDFDEVGKEPFIEIEDDGDGMTLNIIREVWMKPATPYKLNQKKSKTNRFTNKGRLMQGDKGVGRFAIYKLGNHVEIFTKTETTEEVQLTLNFREYAQNDEFSDEEIKHRYLDEIENQWKVNEDPICITNPEGKGTLIRISDLRNNWTFSDLERLEVAFQRMIPPVIPNFEKVISRDFDVQLLWNDRLYPKSLMSFEQVIELAPFSMRGSITDSGVLSYTYHHNRREVQEDVDLFDITEIKSHDVWNLRVFKEQFLEESNGTKKSGQIKIRKRTYDEEIVTRSKWKVRRRPQVGECLFFFYAFDWGKNKLELSTPQEAFIKDNSVYLYRDFTRVYPFGEKGIDWLMLSKMRAEDRAARYFSYNDLIGFVFISQEHNPRLRDAADREGLMNVNGAYDDFVALLQAALKVMKDHVSLDRHRDELRREKAFTTASQRFQKAFKELKAELDKTTVENTLIKAKRFFKATQDLIDQYKEKLTVVQELAGVGMAVEKSSHDIFVLLRNMIQTAEDVIKRFAKGKLSPANLEQFLSDLKENLEFLHQEIEILQPLFRIARKVTREVSVKDAVQRVERYYQRELRFNINFKLEGDDIIVSTNLGLMMQVFINLVDNAVYWLNQKKGGKRSIIVRIDNVNRNVVFADDGPGISEELSEIVFSEFYSTKAEGRGLGLYIVRELLDRIGATISVITTDGLKILPGANFLIQFPQD